MTHALDNPVWYALISGNKTLAQGTAIAKTFLKEVSPIAGLQEYDAAHFNALYDIVPPEQTIVIFSVNKLDIPDVWSVLLCLTGFQMVYTATTIPQIQEDKEIIPLTNEHISQMLTLTKLTNPGPFSSRTIEFGKYEGIFKDDTLVAMAGQRLQPYPYTEISAVCTHPDYTGKGYARRLILRQVHYILEAGCIPFLHVREDNGKAINVYKSLGFEVRTSILFYVLTKKV